MKTQDIMRAALLRGLAAQIEAGEYVRCDVQVAFGIVECIGTNGVRHAAGSRKRTVITVSQRMPPPGPPVVLAAGESAQELPF